MESATILTPPNTDLYGICFPSEPNIPEGPEYEKNINTIHVREENLAFPRGTTTAVATSKYSGKRIFQPEVQCCGEFATKHAVCRNIVML